MALANIDIIKEYKALLRNAVLVFSIVILAVVSTEVFLAVVAPTWFIRLFVILGIEMTLLATWLLYITIKQFVCSRNQMLIMKWVLSYVYLFLGVLPIVLYIYLNLDWHLLAIYGKMVFDIYMSFENILLPFALLLLLTLIYWTLTIQLYKQSYITYLCINKKKEIYGE